VILSVSICNRKGKILLARQYVPMSRLRIEGLLAAFPKLIDADERSRSKQHTFIETTEVRYIYQPLDTLYLLLVTNMQSNILSDLSTLRMIAKLIPEYCGGHDEETVSNHAFNLLYALDEVVTPMGYKEPCSYNQIAEFVKMDSAEEKLSQIIEESKIKNAQEVMDKKRLEFEKQRAEERKRMVGSRPLDAIGAFSSRFGGNDSQNHNVTHISSDSYMASHRGSESGNVRIETHDNNRHSKYSRDDRDGSDSDRSKSSRSRRKPGSGMTLKAPKKQDKLFKEAAEHDKAHLDASKFEAMLKTNGGGDDVTNNADLSPIEISISERLMVTLDRDGAMKKFEVKGDMEVVVNDPDSTQCVIETNVNPKRKLDFGKPTWKVHPRMNSSEWKRGVLCLKDLQKKFKVGRSNKTAILRWRMATKDEDRLPLTIEFWPEQEAGAVTVSAQFSTSAPLKNAIITFPTPTKREPEISSCEHGDTAFYKTDHELQWILNDLEPDSSGSLEYVVEDVDVEDLWPISVHFEMEDTYSQIQVTKVRDIDDEQTFEHSLRNSCVAEKYIME